MKNEIKVTEKANQSRSATIGGGKYQVYVLNEDGTIAYESGLKKNLILNPAIDDYVSSNATSSFDQLMRYGFCGTGNTPNSEVKANSLYTQAGDQVTRSSGTANFVANDVDNMIKFGSGEEARIVTVNSGTVITVDRLQTVTTPASVTVYNTKRTALDSQVAYTETRMAPPVGEFFQYTVVDVTDADYPRVTLHQSYLFTAAQTENNTITELGVGLHYNKPTFSRIVLDDPVILGPGQQLGFKYQMTSSYDFTPTDNVPFDITGWPVEYNTAGIVDNGDGTAEITVAPSAGDTHHYQVGGNVIISGAQRVKRPIASITSTATEFTLTTSVDHQFTTGDDVEILGVIPNSYNGGWVVASTPTTTTLTITSALNAGAGSGGTIREADPITWWNGEHEVTAIDALNNTITVSIPSGIAEAGDGGVITNSDLCEIVNKGIFGTFFTPTYYSNDIFGTDINAGGFSRYTGQMDHQTSGSYCNQIMVYVQGYDTRIYNGFYQIPSFPNGQNPVPYNVTDTARDLSQTYVPGSFTSYYTKTFSVSDINYDNIKQILIGWDGFSGGMNKQHVFSMWFHEPQKKTGEYTLTFNYSIKMFRTLED
jgi:hypothetical protein